VRDQVLVAGADEAGGGRDLQRARRPLPCRTAQESRPTTSAGSPRWDRPDWNWIRFIAMDLASSWWEAQHPFDRSQRLRVRLNFGANQEALCSFFTIIPLL
jgi:hypothetical protein